MKKNLGSWLLILLLSSITLGANENSFALKFFKKSAFVGEGLYFEVRFRKKANNTFVRGYFRPKDSSDVEYERIGLESHIVGHDEVTIFKYLLFGKTSGEHSIGLEGIIGHVTEDELRSASNYADAAGVTKLREEIFPLNSVSISLKENPKSLLVGDVRVEMKRIENEVYENEPLHIEVSLKGYGRLKEESVKLNLPNYVDLFSDKVLYKEEIRDNKLYSSKTLQYALVSQKPYLVENENIIYLHDTTGEEVNVEKKTLSIIPKDASAITLILLDTESHFFEKKEHRIDWIRYLSYLLFFIFGFISAKISFKRFFNVSRKTKVSFKDEQALARYLCAHIDEGKNESLLRALELKEMTFNEVKRLVTN
jgi:hypothetical protein